MNKSAFTLVELIVGVTISMLLMTSIGVFVSSGMSNITLQSRVLDDNKEVSSTLLQLHEIIGSSTKEVFSNNSGLLLKINPYFDQGGYTYIGTKDIDRAYCQTGETTVTNHLFSSNFIPFEEIGEEIIEINGFVGTLESAIVNVAGVDHKSNIYDHQILKQVSGVWEVAVGKDIFGSKLVEGSVGTGVFLNSPTGMVNVEGKLVFSDTLNNRILYLSGGLTYTLLDENDGLQEPTGLAYSGGILYISNSAKGEILKLSSNEYTSNPELNLLFQPNVSFDADRFEITFLTGSISLDWTMNKSNFSSVTSSNINDEVLVVGNSLNYYFINSFGTEGIQGTCVNSELRDEGIDLIQCTSSGTGVVANMDRNSFIVGSDYSINVSGITPHLTANSNYYVSLEFKDGITQEYQKYLPYFTQGDNDIFTKSDNNLEIFTGALLYPTGLNINGLGQLIVNTFEDRKTHIYNSDGTKDSESTKTLVFNHGVFTDYFHESLVLQNPIQELRINTLSNFLNVRLDYYKYFNCFNNEEKVKKTYLFKKSF